jgi:hypothetical protein
MTLKYIIQKITNVDCTVYLLHGNDNDAEIMNDGATRLRKGVYIFECNGGAICLVFFLSQTISHNRD